MRRRQAPRVLLRHALNILAALQEACHIKAYLMTLLQSALPGSYKLEKVLNFSSCLEKTLNSVTEVAGFFPVLDFSIWS